MAVQSLKKQIGSRDFDCQYVNRDIRTGSRGPLELRQAWINGSDATWWCTGCWCQNFRKLTLPLKDSDKIQMRFELGIGTKEGLDRFHDGSLTWKPSGSSRKGQKWAPIQPEQRDSGRLIAVSWQGRASRWK